MGFKLIIDKIKKIFDKGFKLEKDSIVKNNKLVKEISPIEKQISILENNGIICDKNAIIGGYPMYKIYSNNPKYFENLEYNGIMCINESYPYNNIMCPNSFIDVIDNKEVTYDDVIKTIKENNNINDKEKNILIEGINKLKKNKLSIDLRILNYNLKGIVFKYKYLEGNDIARYQIDENVVYIDARKTNYTDKQNYRRVLLHEVLGHASNLSYIKDNGGILCSTHMMFMADASCDNYAFNVYGQSFDEAIAEYITEKAINKKFDSNMSGYLPYLYELLILCKCVDMTIDDYIKYGISYLVDKLVEKELNEGILLLQIGEQKFNSLLYCSTDYNSEIKLDMLIVNLLSKVAFINYSNNIDKDNNLTKLNEIINVYNNYINPTNYQDKKLIFSGTTEQNIQELDINYIKTEINNIVNNLYTNQYICTK